MAGLITEITARGDGEPLDKAAGGCADGAATDDDGDEGGGAGAEIGFVLLREDDDGIDADAVADDCVTAFVMLDMMSLIVCCCMG